MVDRDSVKNPENTKVNAGQVEMIKRVPDKSDAKEPTFKASPPPPDKDVTFVDYGHKIVLPCLKYVYLQAVQLYIIILAYKHFIWRACSM